MDAGLRCIDGITDNVDLVGDDTIGSVFSRKARIGKETANTDNLNRTSGQCYGRRCSIDHLYGTGRFGRVPRRI